jgi:homoserine O-acetyltransferase
MREQKYIHNGAFRLEAGGCLEKLEIAYHTAGEWESGKNNVIWVCHALTANSDPSDWWSNMVGEGKLYSPSRHFIVCANIIGSCYGTTGPLSVDSNTGEPYYDKFPLITIRDMVAAHEILRQHLGITHIHTLIGSSVGAFQALEWSIMQPNIFDYMFFIASNCRVSPWATAFNESQRAAIRADATFACRVPHGGIEGLKAARSIALLSYRSYSGYDKTQQEDCNDALEAAKASSYQRYQGEKLARRFNAYSYYSLTKSIDTHNVGRNRNGTQAALAKVKTRTLLIAISSDILFPPHEMEYMHKNMPNSEFCCISSDFGHDGFLIEAEQLHKIIENFYN